MVRYKNTFPSKAELKTGNQKMYRDLVIILHKPCHTFGRFGKIYHTIGQSHRLSHLTDNRSFQGQGNTE